MPKSCSVRNLVGLVLLISIVSGSFDQTLARPGVWTSRDGAWRQDNNWLLGLPPSSRGIAVFPFFPGATTDISLNRLLGLPITAGGIVSYENSRGTINFDDGTLVLRSASSLPLPGRNSLILALGGGDLVFGNDSRVALAQDTFIAPLFQSSEIEFQNLLVTVPGRETTLIGRGTTVFSGPDALAILPGNTFVGSNLLIENGASVYMRRAEIGLFQAGRRATVTGSGSLMQVQRSLFVGDFLQAATLSITNGAAVTVGRDLEIGRFGFFGGRSTGVVSGQDSSLSVTQSLRVGVNGRGLFVMQGGMVEAGDVEIGREGQMIVQDDAQDQPGSLKIGTTITNRGELTFDHAGFMEVDVNMRGSGQLVKKGSGTTLVKGDLSYTGGTALQEGTFLFNGSMNGPVTINANTTFGGVGVLNGDLTNGGTLMPGLSPGILNVTGNYIQSTNGLLAIELGGTQLGQFDQLNIIGTAQLAGTVGFTLSGGFFPSPGDAFNFLNASGGVSGTFGNIEMPASVQIDLVYTDTSVTALTRSTIPTPTPVSPSPSPTPPGPTPTPINPTPAPTPGPTPDFLRRPYTDFAFDYETFYSASAMETVRANRDQLGPDAVLVTNTLDFLPVAELQIALESLAPREVAAFRGLAFATANQLASVLQIRMADARRGHRGFSLSGVDMIGAEQGGGSGSAFFAPDPENRWGTWVDGAGIFGNVESNPVLNRGGITGGAMTIGLDYALADNAFLGLYTGYVGVESRPGQGSQIESTGARLGLYGSYGLGGFYVSGLIGGSWQDYDWDRPILIPTLAPRFATANPDGATFQSLLETGYEHRIGNLVAGGFGVLDYTNSGIDAFSESGAGILGVSYASQNVESLRSSLGIRLAYEYEVCPEFTVVPSASVAWEHEFMNGAQLVNGLIGNTGLVSVRQTPGASDTVTASGGVQALISDNWEAYLYYTGSFGGTYEVTHGVNGGLRFEF